MNQTHAFPTEPQLKVTHPWGEYNPKMWLGNGRHMGVDIAGVVGKPIFAVCDGVVTTASQVDAHGYGRHIILDHGGPQVSLYKPFRTLYGHLHKLLVKEGTIVHAGQQIGEMGGDPKDSDKVDGASTGAHLHLEMIYTEQPANLESIKTWAGWTVDPLKTLAAILIGPVIGTGIVKEAEGVKIRLAPGVADLNIQVGALSLHEKVEFIEKVEINGNTWGRLRSLRPEWVCLIYKGSTLIKWEDAPQTTPEPEPTPQPVPALDEKAIRRDEINRHIAFLQKRESEL